MKSNFIEYKNKSLVEINNLIKTNLKNNLVINIKNLKVKTNERIVLFSPPEAGKSFLCEIIAGIRKYNKGQIIKKPNIRINLQTIHNNYSKITSCYDYIKLYLNSYSTDLRSDRVYDLLKKLDLWNVFKKPFYKLTFTQQQKVNILLAIITKPDLIILDDITMNLDQKTKKPILNLLLEYYNSNDSSYILVTDNLADIKKMADRIIFLYKGRIIEDMNYDELINRYDCLDKFIDQNFIEYKELKKENKKIFSWKDEIDDSWKRKWDYENNKRKTRSSKNNTKRQNKT